MAHRVGHSTTTSSTQKNDGDETLPTTGHITHPSQPQSQSSTQSGSESSTSVALDTDLATAISSSSIEKCDSPDDTSSFEGSTQSAANTPAADQTDDLHCVLKDMEEYEFAVGVAEDRNKRCRRTMEDTHAFIYNYEGITGHGFFAIFDGHAGKSAADWCGQHFHE
ncbi:Protein phosphatase 2C 1, partial [Podila epigama]